MSINIKTQVTVTASIDFNEGELKALEAIACYGTRSFLNMFYTHLGKAYLQPHEKNVIALFHKIQCAVPPALMAAKEAREYAGLPT